MADDSSQLTGPDFEKKGIRIDEVADGAMVQGHAFGEAVLMARRGAEFFAIGATCTHYGGPLAEGCWSATRCAVPGIMPASACGPARQYVLRH